MLADAADGAVIDEGESRIGDALLRAAAALQGGVISACPRSQDEGQEAFRPTPSPGGLSRLHPHPLSFWQTCRRTYPLGIHAPAWIKREKPTPRSRTAPL